MAQRQYYITSSIHGKRGPLIQITFHSKGEMEKEGWKGRKIEEKLRVH